LDLFDPGDGVQFCVSMMFSGMSPHEVALSCLEGSSRLPRFFLSFRETAVVQSPIIAETRQLTFSSHCLQCFDLVGRQEGHPACKKPSGGMLVWLSVWGEV